MRLASRDPTSGLYTSSLPFSILALRPYHTYAYAYAYAYTDARVQAYIRTYLYIYIYIYIQHLTCAVDNPVRNDTDSFAPQRCRRRG